jgi:PAS domain S-box-containing protein
MGGLSSFTQRESSIRLLRHLQDFLDLVVASPASYGSCRYLEEHDGINDMESSSPMSGQSSCFRSSSLLQKGLTDRIRATVYDIAMEVVITPLVFGSDNPVQRKPDKRLECKQAVQATCTITTSTQGNSTYFTLIFAGATKVEPSYDFRSPTGGPDRTESRFELGLHDSESSPSANNCLGSVSETLLKDSTTIRQQVEFSPSFSALACTQSKASKLKDAILNSINMPAYGSCQSPYLSLMIGLLTYETAMWKDESFGIPNNALLDLLPKNKIFDPNSQRAFLEQYTCWTEDFQRELVVDEFPIVQICRTQQRVSKRRTGMRHPQTGNQIVYEISGEPVIDDETGEFLGGIVIFTDVTEYTRRIAAQIEVNEKQFESIANFMPVMVRTTIADGTHDWFSQRWYDYTGLTVEQSLGEGWKAPIHPEDLVRCETQWSDSVRNGIEYNTEHRCRRYDGKWHWMLGRALPFHDDLGRIVKWFGTCIDIHDQVQAIKEAREMREQLQRVIEHARIILWAADRQNKLVLFEGDMGRNGNRASNTAILGKDTEEIFDGLRGPDLDRWNLAIQEVLRGNPQDGIFDRVISKERCYRTRLVPLWRYLQDGDAGGNTCVDGVVGMSMDITELREREAIERARRGER